MSKEKQIEEMARMLLSTEVRRLGNIDNNSTAMKVAEVLYNTDFRKQNEGHWYKIDGFPRHHFCSKCHKGNRTKSNFCPNCGAKMKGGKAEETKKHFTPEDVRKMSQGEVRENYQAILDSMKKWK